ncbi:TonB-dependent siderophore receptor [Aquabacterium sp. A7-Y]|uniref:TonB-dependent siderophore receptor n=1 Tax=Aquabacterium sp. A7-Y TaxID=1349605 RepID=UPI00223D871B|nr:TonB-dependent siderophore receptor [Aquabacterium sp. A7-Y]MCW7541545.1 TonB-dependent siderophore receptor [Aquabacterium sp. A7-Y]
MASQPRPTYRLSPVALVCLLGPAAALAQESTPGQTELPGVTVRGQAPTSRSGVAGFGDVPLVRTPLQARTVPLDELKDRGLTRLSDLTQLDASVSDSYNSEGYWDYLSVRGFVLDNRYNYRRDGLPISGETSIPLQNKAAIELLKGTSGIQAGTSAPGGLVNYVVKRPEGRVRSIELGYESPGTVGVAADVGERFGDSQRFGLRVNAAFERLDSHLHDDQGHRKLLAVAGDWRLTPDTVLEAEFETSKRSQPSQPGFSLLGDRLPEPVNPRINLNNQPWTQPVIMEGNTGSLRLQHRFSPQWRFTAHYGVQRLETDDRLAYAFGCTSEVVWHRYCSDGSFDLYEFISDNEVRRTDALNLFTDGRFTTGPLKHELATGVLLTRFKARFEPQIYTPSRDPAAPDDPDIIGKGTVDGNTMVLPSNGATSPNTNRTERSTEFYARDAIQLSPQWSAWLGLRHTRIHRESIGTDGSNPTDYKQSFTTPWAALSYEFLPHHFGYVSWGRGVESKVVPNRTDRYTNPGQSLPPMKSRQVEVGFKASTPGFDWGVNLFDIDRPRTACIEEEGGCAERFDGSDRHRGLEATAGLRWRQWQFDGSLMLLDAEIQGSQTARLNGREPINVPKRTFKAQARYRVPGVNGLSLLASLTHEGKRLAADDRVPEDLPEIHLPSWTRYDLGLVHEQKWQGQQLRWRAGIQNVTDKKAWRESPFMFDHVYLYPMAPRTFFVSLQTDLQ